MLSRTSEYALRAMVYLVQHKSDWPIPVPRIAAKTKIPQKYLSTILRTLVRQRILEASRGKGGGFRMKRSPETTPLFDVVAPFEPRLSSTSTRCPFGNPICNEDHPCSGHKRWKRVNESYLQFLKSMSLYQVATPKQGR